MSRSPSEFWEEGRGSFVKSCRNDTSEKPFRCREVGKDCLVTSGFLQCQVTHQGMTRKGRNLTGASSVQWPFPLCKGITSEVNLEKPSATISHLASTRESILEKGLMSDVVWGIL